MKRVMPPAAEIAAKIEALNLILSGLATVAVTSDRKALQANNAGLSASLTRLQLLCSALNDEREVKHKS
jgi:hypothetical protein